MANRISPPGNPLPVNGHVLDLESLFPLHQQPGYYNPRAQAALLRRSQRGPHDELVVDFSGSEVQIELRAGGRPLLRGPWTWQARINAPGEPAATSEPLAATGSWGENCWHSDADGDYLEIELPLAGGWRIERQLLLARQDRFLLLADALLGPAAPAQPELRFTSALPIATGAGFIPAKETREGVLVANRQKLATVVPLALPEWRAEFAHADLSVANESLKLQQAAAGRALFAPLWIDLDPRRTARPLTWRRLTVAENLQVVPRDVAAGYRVQIGSEQWLLYRSLGNWGNRTVLGQNYVREFVCSRFLKSGSTHEIIAIEPCE